MTLEILNTCTELQDVNTLTNYMLTLPQADAPVVHTFNDGQYIRELTAKAGLLIVGHKHKKEHINIFLKGKIALLTEDGWKIMEAPQYFIGGATQKVAYIIEDMTWLNVHRTNLTDIDAIEAEIYDTANVYKENTAKLNRIEDVLDFEQAVLDIGLTLEEVRKISEIDNVITSEAGTFKFKIAKSNIEGLGVHATADISAGEFIGTGGNKENRFVLGRYVNHAKDPNAEFRMLGDFMCLYAIKPIKGCKGSMNGDEITIDYRQSFKISMENL